MVTDGNQRAALAVTRSLGSKGIKVITADVISSTLSGASKYSYDCETYTSQNREEEFLASIKQIVDKQKINVIYPITEITMFILLKHRDEFPGVSIPFDTYEKVSRLCDKANLIDICTPLDIPFPASIYVKNGGEALENTIDFQYPVVLKPYKSRILADGQWLSTSVNYAASRIELERLCTTDPVFSAFPFIVQEYIEGYGQGVFLVFDQGRLVASFCHKRLREKPPSGGVSVLCKSEAIDTELERMAIQLLEQVQWHGVAMVEFKVNEVTGPYIMEVNTRFWGSLQLAVDAGVDFPLISYQIAIGESPPKLDKPYKIGVRLRWLLGDLDRLYLVLKSSEYNLRHKLSQLVVFFVPWQPGLRYEVNRLSDIRPFFEEVKQYFSEIFRSREK